MRWAHAGKSVTSRSVVSDGATEASVFTLFLICFCVFLVHTSLDMSLQSNLCKEEHCNDSFFRQNFLLATSSVKFFWTETNRGIPGSPSFPF